MARTENELKSFIDDEKIFSLLEQGKNSSKEEILEIIQKSLSKQRLEPIETAKLLNVEDKELLDEIFKAANTLKEEIYGDRIVFFAPLYIGNKCINNCKYCGFQRDNTAIERKTLTLEELREQVKILESKGHKRLILVYGEHPDYDADFIAQTMRTVYDTKNKNGEIRRVNINAAPMEVEDYKKLKEAGIGTFQIFQETYHHETYQYLHPQGDMKGDYSYRLYGLDRAMEAGIDDVGIGALFGLYDWRFEVMGLLFHAIHLEEKFGVGPHTISFPRIEPALNNEYYNQTQYKVSDDDFKKIVAILRLSVPYTGMILTARETKEVRKEIIPYGISQIDAGSRIGIGGYTLDTLVPTKEQFQLGDTRELDDVVREMSEMNFLSSFCTACYRSGRTGEDFMCIAKPGDIQHFCAANGILTFKEYLIDYASPQTKIMGEKMIEKELEKIGKESPNRRELIENKIKLIEQGQRDVYI
ncbi:[FeFe] hydrogenase H-cluster radical SAM maturase HydG [Soehngenia longivitae]|uniref:[FeFe] hydrogenase H-cluster radical SAM maturase HydG n=1 Tax=Soehngenia longivitae TaxID=2562294 RepID=A0A4Z0D908_9FIRM|nr:[FeFe] hydrogenase H-cluster radical SAM maturase HydG [Soehngenia longivitae]TFZ41388.1 [FeFe] hydrogenase H-cluster radical SAM maturase HydG [Soehngenia longivitae]